METFEMAMEQREVFGASLDMASDRIRSYPAGKMGLTPDSIKASDEWKADKRAFDVAMRNNQQFNTLFLRKYKKEYMQYRRNERAKR